MFLNALSLPVFIINSEDEIPEDIVLKKRKAKTDDVNVFIRMIGPYWE